MLSQSEIKTIIDNDKSSDKKRFARVGQRYYEGQHDIKRSRLFYYNADGILEEDKTRSNVKITHAFFTELVDQAVQYTMSGRDRIVRSDDPELQNLLDVYFADENFVAEMAELLTTTISQGVGYMYAYKNVEGRTAFMAADSLGVAEVRAKDTDDGCEYVVYWYVDRVDKNNKAIKRIQVWDKEQTYYFVQENDGAIIEDTLETINPKPHILYTKSGDAAVYYEGFGFIPFFRLDYNKKQISLLAAVKDLIDDYDIMASSLSNNLIDFDTPLNVVRGFQGDNLEELQQNLKTKKIIGVEEGGGVEVHTVDIPYQARKEKLELDEKNIYRFGMGLNTAGLKDTNATTNIAIKMAYSLLELKCFKLETRLKQFLRKITKIVLAEINDTNNTDYQLREVYFEFEHEIMSNASENAQIALVEAQEEQTRITTLLNLATQLDNETLMQNICEVLDIDYEEIKNKLPDPDEAMNSIEGADAMLGESESKAETEATSEEIKDQAKEEVGVALNGAQTQSLLSIIQQYKSDILSVDEAVSIIAISIGVTEDRARKLLHIV